MPLLSPDRKGNQKSKVKSTQKRNFRLWLLALGFLGFLLSIAFIPWLLQTRFGNSVKRLPPLPQDPFVQVYFNHNPAAEYTEPYRQLTRTGDDLEQLIVDAIASAQSTVDVAVQELRLPKIAQALVDRHNAGVKVRVILENNYSRPWSEFTAAEVAKLEARERDRYNEFRQLTDINKDGQLSANEINTRDALVMLRSAGVPIIDDTADGSKGSGLMHHKFVIIDGNNLIVTSANFTTSDTHGDFKSPSSRGNPNNLLKIQSPQIGALFTEEFNLMWGDGLAGKPDSKFGLKKPFRPMQQFQLGETTVAVQFDPSGRKVPWEQSVNGSIGQTLSQATRTVDLALFVFSEQQLVNILEARHEGGVQVRSLIDPGFAYRSYSENLDMMGVAIADNCKYEPDNRPWQNPIKTAGVPELPPGDLLHHKFGIIDGRIAIAGSHNWSLAANTNNDETLLVIESQIVSAHFVREFEQLYAGARLGIPQTVQQKIQEQLQQCPPPSPAPSSPSPHSLPASGEGWGGVGRDGEGSEAIAPAASSALVNLNTASQKELEELPGVGPKLAGQIIAARQQKAFTSIEDLDRVPGVGPKMLEKLRDRVTF